MTSMPKKDNQKKELKVGLGEKTDSEYRYSSRINFGEDLSLQIAKLMQEKKAKDELEEHIKQISKIASRFKNKKKNLAYYNAIGKMLSFLSSANFKNIRPYSVFRRLVDEIPDILPGLEVKRVQDHLMMMYRIGKLDKDTLDKATWEQWYEISKFKNVTNNQKTLSKILVSSGNSSGLDLRKKIESIVAAK